MERRVLLAIFLAFLVLYAYQALFVPAVVPPSSSRPAPSAPPPPLPGPSASPLPVEAAAPASETPAASPLVADASERDIRFETADVIAVFTNRGGRLESWRLKRYHDETREPLELVPAELSNGQNPQPLPFSLSVPDEATTRTLNSALYTVRGEPAPNALATTPTQLTFEYRDTAGLHVVKEFRLEPASYVVTFRSSVRHGERTLSPTVQWGPAVSLSSHQAGSYAKQAGGLTYQNRDLKRLYAADVAKQPAYDGNFEFAGVDDHYFVTMAIKPGQAKVSFRPVSASPPAGSPDAPAVQLMAWSVERTDPETPLKVFAGPKDLEVLTAIDQNLTKAINFGWFDFIVVPLLRSLNWIHGYVGNYGWSIIILTILINAVLFPLRHKSVVSMRKMQEIQPEAKAIQDRYAKLKATDPARQKMNQELMALYRERGVNPASGCVPMLLTLPVFLAFYSLLTVAIELRGAPFFGWIHDLSRPDPLYVTPVLMGVTQIWQMRITPQTGADPAQQKMMMIMPIVFMVFFLWTSAGALLYWLVSNVWGIGQQYLTNYLIGPPMVRGVRPPAERRVKRVGSGKTEAASRED